MNMQQCKSVFLFAQYQNHNNVGPSSWDIGSLKAAGVEEKHGTKMFGSFLMSSNPIQFRFEISKD